RDLIVTGVQTCALPIYSLNVNTDSRKAVVGQFNANYGCNTEGDCSKGASLGLELRPRSNVTVSLNPSVNRSETGFQFVDSYADRSEERRVGKEWRSDWS